MPLFESDTAATRTGADRYRALGAQIDTIDAATSTSDISFSLPGSKAGIHAARSGSAVDTAYTGGGNPIERVCRRLGGGR